MAEDHEANAPATDRKDRSGKKSKHEKGEHKSKKRHRETTDAAEGDGTERKHKRSKSHVPREDPSHDASAITDPSETSAPAPLAMHEHENGESKKEKKSKKSKKDKQAQPHQDTQRPVNTESQESPQDLEAGGDEPSKRKKKSKKDQKRHEVQEDVPAPAHKKKGKRRHKEGAKASEADNAEPMDIDSTPARPRAVARARDGLTDQAFPFFTQTVSQYLPLFPQGMVEPIEGYAEQHLRPLLNRYVPAFRGVLLAYRNPRIGEAPGKGSLTERSETDDATLLETIDEYAVGFAWLTVEADLFCPKRGSWMEGTLNLQSEGFIGVICFGMFNASIEASRLPSSWKWVDLLSRPKDKAKRPSGKSAAESKLPTPEPQDDEAQDEVQDEAQDEARAENEGDETHQAHSTGYWVDENGSKVGGGKLRFRIKNYEVGSIGDYGYLSIEGTMLDEDAEKGRVAEEVEMDRRRKLRQGGLLRKPFKRLPEFSMTKFGKDDDEQDDDLLRSIGLKPKRRPDGGNDAASS